MSSVLASSVLFFVTLESFGFARFYFVGALVMLAFLYVNRWLIINRFELQFVYIVFFMLLLSVALTDIGFMAFKNNEDFSYMGFIVSTLMKAIVVLPVIMLCNRCTFKLHRVIGYVIALHLGFFFIQYVCVYFTGVYIDPLNLIMGIEQRYQTGLVLPIVGELYRPTGMYIEPSTYSTFIMILVCMRVVLMKSLTRIDGVAISSAVLSFSAAAFAYASIALLVVALTSMYRKKAIPYLIVFFCLVLPVALQYLEVRSAAGSRELGDLRIALIEIVFSQDMQALLFGNGLLGIPSVLADIQESSILASYNVAAINDAGLWLFIIMKLGVIGFMLLICAQYRFKTSLRSFLFIMLALLTKASLYDATLILLLVLPFFVKFGVLKNKNLPKFIRG